MRERGVALIETVVAVAILASVGVSSLGYLAAVMDAQARLGEREAELVRAERVLIASALLTQKELEQRLGARRVEEFVVWVDRPEPRMFRIGVAPATHPAAELLATLVYRAPAPVEVPDGT